VEASPGAAIGDAEVAGDGEVTDGTGLLSVDWTTGIESDAQAFGLLMGPFSDGEVSRNEIPFAPIF
jgi:hypothetical protein